MEDIKNINKMSGVASSDEEEVQDFIKNDVNWQDIYASRQSNKILTAELSAVEKINVRVSEAPVECGVVFYGGIKVFIPVDEMNVSAKERFVIRSMIGAEIDFVVIGIDSENKIVVASRKTAMELRREVQLTKHKVGDRVLARITGVGKNNVIAEVYGIESRVEKEEVDYGYIYDLHEYMAVGDKVAAVIKKLDFSNYDISISFKECKQDPFDSITERYKVKGEYLGTISGIQSFGIFVKLEQGIYALCPHTNWSGFVPAIGDKVLIMLKRIDRENRKINASLIRRIRKA
ncbi:hypothetical protein [Clostridium oryzae]|uniref:30S ribosomal protein S1 n=1 Tax=Clostridium oryzae TaxID=1450648 RepID=A0A1V4IIW1_9CLOT|nr:hypothetical protein [Clostridium oryzae]OPJ59780.1 30S ribosomal protein S1 [Clostridium oryzae]